MPDLCWIQVLHDETTIARSTVLTHSDFLTESRQSEEKSKTLLLDQCTLLRAELRSSLFSGIPDQRRKVKPSF